MPGTLAMCNARDSDGMAGADCDSMSGIESEWWLAGGGMGDGGASRRGQLKFLSSLADWKGLSPQEVLLRWTPPPFLALLFCSR
eukprot:1604726-Rhodomonas_salina.1